jgi:hypothetical protein
MHKKSNLKSYLNQSWITIWIGAMNNKKNLRTNLFQKRAVKWKESNLDYRKCSSLTVSN